MPYRVMHIFRAGRHVTSAGETITFSDNEVQAMAEAYNMAGVRCPIILGHADESKVPHYGTVGALVASPSGIHAMAEVSQDLIGLVRSGAYRKVSAAFHRPDGSANPAPGAYFLRHVAVLGAQPPAIKGLEAMEFSECGPMFALHDGAGSYASALEATREFTNLSFVERLRLANIASQGRE